MIIHTFYDVLNLNMRQLLDADARGTLGSKAPEATWNLIEEMVMNSYQWWNT